MSETEYETDHSDYSVANEMFGPTEAGPTDYADYSDEALEAELDALESDDDYYEDPAQGQPPDLEELVGQGLAAGQDPYLAGLQARQQADEWWANYNAREEYDRYVDEQANLADAAEVADDLIQQAGQRHDVRESAASGRLLQVATGLFSVEAQRLFDTGEEETLALLRSPEGARWAIDAAAQLCYRDAFATPGRGVGVDRIPETEHSRRMRAAFDTHMRGR